MKKLLLLMLISASVFAQVDTIKISDTPNEGRIKINRRLRSTGQMTKFVSLTLNAESDPYYTSIARACSAASGGTVQLAPGTYEIDATILVPSNTVIEGNGAVIHLSGLPSTEGVFKNYNITTGDSNITIRNVKVDVDSITSSQTGATNAFVFYRSKNVRIENCEVWDNRNYGFYFLGCNKVKLIGCRTRNTDSPFEFRQKTYDVELVNCSSEAGPYQTMGLFIWENCHDISVTNLQVSGQGNGTANVGIQILDSWGINIANSNINITGGASNAGIYIGVDAIGSTSVVSPPPVAHDVEDVQIINSTFTVDKTGFYTLGKQAYWYRNIRLSNVIFFKPSTGDTATRLFNLQGLNDGLLLDKVVFRDSTVSTSPEMFYARFVENARISESSFFSSAASGHKVLLVEPWRTRVVGCTFGDSVVFKTDFYNDADTRHSYNGYNVYRENTFNARSEPNMHVRWEKYGDVVGNKFLYLDSANLATTKSLFIGTGSQHLNIDKNVFSNPTIVDSSYYSNYGGNDFGVGTRKAAYGDITSITQIRSGADFNDYGSYKANFIAKDTTRIDSVEGTQRTVAEFQGRAAGSPDPDDISLLVTTTRMDTGNTGWQSAGFRMSYAAGDVFRTYATNKSFLDFGNAQIRMGTAGSVRDLMNSSGNRFIYDPLFLSRYVAVETVYVAAAGGGNTYIGHDGSGNLTFSDAAGGTEYTLAQLAGSAPIGDSSAFIYKVTGGAYKGDTLEISPAGYISIGRSGSVVTFTPDTSSGKLATQTMNNLKLAKTDTASLSGRIDLKLAKTDTASLSNRINLKLNASAAFIGGYTVSRTDSMKLLTGTGISMSQSGGNITVTATELRKVPAYVADTTKFLRSDSTWKVPPGGTSSLDTAAVNGLIAAGTVAIQTTSGYRAVDSSGVIVNEGPTLLAQVTLDSSVIALTDTVQMGYALRAVTVSSIVLVANGTVSLTPRFMFNDTLGGAMTAIISSPAALTTARVPVTLSSLNNTAVGAGSIFAIKFDSITTKPPKLSVYVYGYRTF